MVLRCHFVKATPDRQPVIELCTRVAIASTSQRNDELDVFLGELPARTQFDPFVFLCHFVPVSPSE